MMAVECNHKCHCNKAAKEPMKPMMTAFGANGKIGRAVDCRTHLNELLEMPDKCSGNLSNERRTPNKNGHTSSKLKTSRMAKSTILLPK